MAKAPKHKVVTHKMRVRAEREKVQTRYLLLGVIIVAVLVIGPIGYGLLDLFLIQQIKPVVQVGSDVVRASEFETNVRYTRWRLISQYSSILQSKQMFGSDASFAQYFNSQLQQIINQLSDSTSLGQSVLDNMAENLVVEQEAKKRGITVTDQEIEDEIRSAFGYYANGTPTPTISPTVFDTPTYSALQQTALAATLTPTWDALTPTATLTPTIELTITPTLAPTLDITLVGTPTSSPIPPTSTATLEPSPTITETPYTLEGFQKSYTGYLDRLKEVNYKEPEFRKIFKYQILRRKLKEAMFGDTKPELEMVWARHILVADDASALKVLERLNAGENWYAIAAEVSLDTNNNMSGGDLGWFGRGQMVSEFDTAAFSMSIGQISQPVQTTSGYHIIQVLGHEVRKLTSSELDSYKEQLFTTWLSDSLRSITVTKADINKVKIPSDPELDAELAAQALQ
jgi:peptidyl-prolyl cis-trans isomerase D